MTSQINNERQLRPRRDGFDRLCRLYFPVSAVGALAANWGAGGGAANVACNDNARAGEDYEGYGYDPNGNRVSLRLRSGETIAYAYDALNRETFKDIPGGTSADVTSRYDLGGRRTFARFGATLADKEDEAGPIRSTVRLERRPCRFGGARAYFICPRCSRHTLRLAVLPDGLCCGTCGRITWGSRYIREGVLCFAMAACDARLCAMKRRMILALVLAGALGACERLAMAPPKADSAPLTLPSGPDVRPFAGLTFPEFVAREGMARFELAALGLTEADISRVQAAQERPSPGVWLVGGGVEALVFYGCGAQGCDAAASVVAVDDATGETFLGVRDGAGAEILVPNLRLEALLRLGSASGSWDDPTPREQPAAP